MKQRFQTVEPLDSTLLTPEAVGIATPDPLRYAFAQKRSAHAGGGASMVDAEQHQSVANQVLNNAQGAKGKRCLYVHVPFCRVRCTYCNFFQYASSQQLIEDYFAALMVELKTKAAMPWTQAAPFHAVYIGGGTPTDLSPAQIKTLGQMIRQHFPLTPDCELTLEGRINRFTDELFESALEGGFNRFSFGIQSFDTQVRRKAKRLDDREVVLKRVQELSATDAAPIVIDLLYGLPFQDLEVWQQDLADFLESGAHGVDLYQLIEMGGTPMKGMIEKGKLPMPADTATKATMFEYGAAFMDKHHLRRLSVNHWARDNRERSLYNSLAKTSAEVLPLGAGAGGNLGGYGFMQHRTLDKYIETINNGDLPLMMVTKSSPQAAINASIKANFDRGVVSAFEVNSAAGYDVFNACKPLFEAWQVNGLAKLEDQYLTLTLAGQFWAVTMAQAMIQLLPHIQVQQAA
ncbi:putative heme utilization radical SAM enzyme HutW [Photobacterium jeanii]|uniref:Putative heme utilization radical SAM enzyme HutW n=1 Tax=Photobacterium jeanii TaxID=858640 RepID=A0A178KQ22_9GAMM|nr:heme anaerobic degradation radical SAM methyltransferase ChuW/HutW [Photobacterium jeanii]OAN18763.1 putative heme utilization radical SAM enzyme HutW [Photobacterium jeanii]PST92827.1 heme anaerobic degradation radical SAM methyltransferase ChuW/HutW [Photobacterium jeanii]